MRALHVSLVASIACATARNETFLKPVFRKPRSASTKPTPAARGASAAWNAYTQQMAQFVVDAGVTAQNIESTTLWPADYMLSGLADSDISMLSGKFVTPQSPLKDEYDVYLWPSTMWYGSGTNNNGIAQPVFEFFSQQSGEDSWTAGPLFYSPSADAIKYMPEWCAVSFASTCTIGAFEGQTGTVSPLPALDGVDDGTIYAYSLETIPAPEDPPLDATKAAELDAFVAAESWQGGWRYQRQSIAEVNTAAKRASSYDYATLTNPTASLSLEVWGPGSQQSGFEMEPSAMPADPFFLFYDTVWTSNQGEAGASGYLTGYDGVTGDRGAFFDADDNRVDADSESYRIPQNGTLVLVNPVYATLTVPDEFMQTMRPILRALEQEAL